MSFLIRKFSRPKWVGSDDRDKPIKANVVADCLIPKASEISVWYAETEAAIDEAKLALLANMEKIATIDVLVIPVEHVEAVGLKIRENAAKKGPASMRTLHRDICDLDLDSLKVVAGVVQRNILEGEAQKKKFRLTEADCKRILLDAIRTNRFQPSDLHPKLSSDLGFAIVA